MDDQHGRTAEAIAYIRTVQPNYLCYLFICKIKGDLIYFYEILFRRFYSIQMQDVGKISENWTTEEPHFEQLFWRHCGWLSNTDRQNDTPPPWLTKLSIR